jgi:hypothetical protein
MALKPELDSRRPRCEGCLSDVGVGSVLVANRGDDFADELGVTCRRGSFALAMSGVSEGDDVMEWLRMCLLVRSWEEGEVSLGKSVRGGNVNVVAGAESGVIGCGDGESL